MGSQHNQRKSACSGKEAFASYRRARSVVKRMKRRSSKTIKIDVYKCEHCHMWHIGSHKFR